MAGALVGGAFLSGFINIVINKSLREDVVNRVLGKKLGPGLVERLKISLLAAEAVLDDAEYKQLGDERVRDWLNCLRDAVYDADDFLYAVLTKAATQKKVRSLLPSFFLNRHRKMVDNMEGVVSRIEFLVSQKDILGLQKTTKDNNLSSSSSSSWRETTCLMEGNIYGREDDQQALIETINDKSESQLSVIPIVGMGGVGKTTLAKWVYSVVEGFDLTAWVCISETFHVADITKKTIEEITKTTCSLGSLNLLQNELQKILSGKKFFIVLDDVWSDDADKWKQFITPFHCGAKGSTILLTTRNQEVASVVQTCPSCTLNELSQESCWLLFAANACFPESNGNPTLVDVGRQIVNKCKGLPLAVETLGRMLRGKDDAEEWNAVLRSAIWDFPMKNSKIIPALLISYFQLPPYLKRCFVYCSLFPKDHYFEKNELVLLWMAEDLLRLPKRGESLEEVGSQCFEELASRLFFKPAEYRRDRYVMHDLLHDLTIFLAGDFYSRIQELGEQEKKVLTRHLSHFSHRSLCPPITKVSNSIAKLESLRTSLYINDFFSMESGESKFKYLRVLSFYKLDVLPDSIGELIHLRYLNLSRCKINSLPESLCSLYNLQTLILHGCSKLTMLPSGMHNLVNLRNLDLRNTSLEEMPGGISKLEHLHTLSSFVVGNNEDNGIQELGGLSNLHGLLEIKKLENVVDVRQATSARIRDKKHIDRLRLKWSSGGDMVSNMQTEREILHSLEPHNGLKELTIRRYTGTIFPDWLGHCSYNNMTRVSLMSCKNCCMLPSLGQLPSLKDLYIQDFGQLSSIGIEFYKNKDNPSLHIAPPFPLLESLEFCDMACWEEWHLPDSKVFPQLKSLQIRDCPMLKGDMLSHVLVRIVSSSMNVSEVRKLEIRQDDKGGFLEMVLSGDTLSFSGCESMVESAIKAMMSINHLSCLQEIEISECSSLTSLPLDAFPNLEDLEIKGCSNLESVSMSEAPHAALQRLSITFCNKLVSLAGEGLAAPNLTHLQVRWCDKLEALPRDMKSLLPSLQSLQIFGCSDMFRLAEGNLPPNLKELEVGICEQQMRDLSWMANFHALTHLEIYGKYCHNIKSYPEVDSLPHLPSLTTLTIRGFPNLETLECNELLRLTSLQQLRISDCWNLENMEGEKLPPSLLRLKIEQCHLLGEHCKNKHQLIWPKISHIPTIQVTRERDFMKRLLLRR
ncbi:putative disease resistance RPP13-like protein 1 isoform X2 [Arachis stenosperma]|nr:putative disease resistance RPP13-like protein 1 isoform X2 [Arachis stenosperma]